MEGNFYDPMQAVRASGSLIHSDFLFINKVGDRSEWDQQGLPSDKIFLTFLRQSLVYYFHCKGVTQPESPLKERIVHWSMLMEQFIL